MLLTNWLQTLNYRGTTARRRSWSLEHKAVESRTEQSVERLETRAYLSAAAASASNSAGDWFATLESESDDQHASRLLVQFTASATAQAGSVEGVQNLLDQNSLEGSVVRGLGEPGVVLIRDSSPDQNLSEQLAASGLVSSVSEDQSVFAQQLPDDTEFAAQQYSFDNTGQFFGSTGSDINAPAAWDKTTGSHSVVVPVIDSGIDYTHPDVFRNVWLNQGEIPSALAGSLTDTDADGLITFIDLNQPANSASVTDSNSNGFIDAGDLLVDSRWENGIDEDGNGLTDDLIGWDFLNNDNDPFDDHRHGTHVAGTIGAVGNNGLGVAGVNWDVSLMALKFLNTQLVGSTSDAILAINYATMMRSQFDTNVRAMNASWGTLGDFNPELQDAITSTQSADILFVAASGNGDVTGRGVDLDNDLGFFPASFDVDNIIAVAATDNNDNLARFSNFGATSVDLAAPGVGIAGLNIGGGLIFRTGTSMATPHVTGTVALLAALRPFATATEIRHAIVGSVRSVGGLSGDVATGGVLDAEAALNIDTFAPLAQFAIDGDGNVVPPPDINTDGGTTQDIFVRYEDDTLLDVSSLDAGDVIVRKQDDGTGFPVSFLFGPNSNIAIATAGYRMTAPGGTWLLEDNGIYEVVVQAGEVSDTGGRLSRETIIGSFEVAIAFAGQIDVTTTADGTTAGTLRAAVQAANAEAGLNTIALKTGETYVLDISGAGEDAAATGDLDITDADGLVIRGNGAVIEVVGGIDRVFDVQASGALTLLDVTIKGGSVSGGGGTGDGGGVRNNGGTLTVQRSLLTENSATNGGAISSTGTTTVINTTISGNTATNGAGIDHTAGTLLLSSVTVADNAATSTGGGIRSSASAQLQNTIVADNTATTSDADTSGTFSSNGHNLIGILGSATGITDSVNGDIAGTSGTPIDPLLGELKNNGGFTSTHRLLPGSPAIDAGDNALAPTVDQRNIQRPIDANRTFTPTVDIGAHERNLVDIQGTKFLDSNSNGVRDEAEPGLAGWTIYLDLNNNAELDPGEPSRVTVSDDAATPEVDETGTYRFIDLLSQDYVVRELLQPGWELTSPQSNAAVALSTITATDGFRLNGTLAFDLAGKSVSFAGDLNDDGIDDFVIGASGTDANGQSSGSAYVVFGKDTSTDGVFPEAIELSSLNGSNGFRINGPAATHLAGESVSNAGDINGDGIGDLVIGAPRASVNALYSGAAYVLFGKNTATSGDFSAIFELSDLNGSNGFRLGGSSVEYFVGSAVSSAGDMNGDGIGDVLIGGGHQYNNFSYVVFGQDAATDGDFPSSIDLDSLDGSTGFRLDPARDGDFSGEAVSSAGDVNGDGFSDVLIGASRAEVNGRFSGAAYVVFGKDASSNGHFSSRINLSSLDGDTGFRLEGPGENSFVGSAVASAGDINGDGIDDILIGAHRGGANGQYSGASYVVFGKNNPVSGGFGSSVNLGDLNGSNGFRLLGEAASDFSGRAVSGVGDVTGDGIDDFLIGADGASSTGTQSGSSYLIFGKNTLTDGAFQASFNLSSLDGSTGFRLDGENPADKAGKSLSAAGDINGDGIRDILIGAAEADPNGTTSAGTTYVVLGRTVGVAFPNSGFWNVKFRPGNSATGIDFGNSPIDGSISGRVFRDLNTNSVRDAGEAGLESWQVFLDEDGDNSLDGGETVVTTDSEGRYSFTGLTPLQTYRVVQVVQAGFEQTRPDPAGGPVIEVSLGAGEERVDVDFGNLDTAGGVGLGSGKLEGFYFVDDNEDGDLDAGEERAGITVYLDLNNNGMLDSPGGTVEPSQATSATGFYRFEQLSGGTYTVRAINAEDREQQFPRNNSLSISDVDVGDFPQSIATGSFNTDTDSIPDLVVANVFTNDLSIMLRNGDSFVAADNVFTGSFQPRSVAVADFNQDGTDDLVVGHESTIVVSILLGQGDGTFGAPITLNMGGGQTTVSTGLFTDDAFPDIAVTSAVSNQAFVVSNTTGSNFSVLHTVSTGTVPSRAEFANLEANNLFNANSNPDLVVSSFGANRVETYFNSGSGSLSAAFTASVGLSPSDLAVADFDQDGRLDVATANQFSDNVTVLFNNGFNGQFDPARTTSYPAGSGPTAIEAVDMNVDGLIDLVVTNGSDSNLAVLFNLGGGVFQSPQNFGVGVFPVRLAWSVTSADFDMDGDPDLAVAKGVSNQAAILENTLTEGAYRVILSGDGDETVSNLNFIVQDILPEFVITESGGSTTVTEDGAADSFDVVLTLQPASDVVLTVVSGTPGQATVDKATLTFTPSNWDTPQTVTVSAADDVVKDGNVDVTVTLSVDDANSDDDYDPVSDRTVTVTTIDNEVTTVALDGSGNLTIDDNSTTGVASDLVLTIVSTNLRITDASTVLVTSVGTRVSDNELLVPLATITNSRIIATLRSGSDSLDASGLSASLSLEASGGSGDDTLKGGGGADVLDGGLGDDDLDGGGGTDTLTITQNGHLSINSTQTRGQGTDTFAGIEHALLESGSGNNRLDASQATIPVTLLGQAGSDTLLGGSAADSLDGGAGTDFAEIVGSNIVLTDGSAPGTTDSLTSLEGLLLIASVSGSTIDASGYTLGPVTIIGSSGDDTLKGGTAADFIFGGAGKDVIEGGAGADFVLGGRGRDTLRGDAGNDTISGGGGRDEIDGGADADVLLGNSGRDTIRGGDGTDFVNGNRGRDQIDGDGGADTLFGGGGADNIAGGLGADRLNGVDRDDTFSQVVGRDTLFGGQRPSARPGSPRRPEPSFTPQVSQPSAQVATQTAAGSTATDDSDRIDDAFTDPLLPELLSL